MSKPRDATTRTFEVPSTPRGSWRSDVPAIGAVMSRLAELYARCLRVELARRAGNAERLGRAIGRLPP